MMQSEYLDDARIHIDDDHAVLLFSFENKEHGLVVDVDLLDCLLADQGRVRAFEPTDDWVDRGSDYE